MAIRSLQLDAVWKKAVLLAAVAAIIAATWFVVRWSMASSATQRVDTPELALYLTQLAPDDPHTHFVAAILLEKSFDPADIARAIRELETAAALNPDNYILWLELGRARERSGDPAGAELALRRALFLAPHYARVQWALGNLLLRQDRIEEAFIEIRKAVAADKAFAGPAASAAWQFFDGDVERIREAVGDSPNVSAALAVLLGRETRLDEAIAIWNQLPADAKPTALKEPGTLLQNMCVEAKRFRNAAEIASELNQGSATVGAINNGGFELAVKPEGARLFEWQIAAGLQPQIVLTTAEKHGGNNSLLLLFNASDAKDFRQVSQTVAVQPGRNYELELFYRADLKTAAIFRWEVASAADGRQIVASDPMLARSEWIRLAVKFRTADGIDGVAIRLLREGCGQVCAVSGNLWFDDFVLREIQ